MFWSYGYGFGTGRIKLKMNIDDISFGVSDATSCGLIINELVSNSLKHAFPDGRSGEVSVSLHSNGKDKFELVVGDNGVGMQQHRDFRSVETLGMHLIILMAEDQLKGTVELDTTDGTKFKVVVED